MQVIHSLISAAKITCQDQKDFNNKTKNLRQDLTLNEYPQEFADSMIKPSRSNRPSDTTYQGTVIIQYVKGISEKFRCTGNRFNVRTIFNTKYTLRGTLMKTEPVTDAQQMKQCVYNIPRDCGKCYIGETSRPSEVHIKEHKYNLT
jgi:hypothetical protein